jgi:hypothetical protein
MMMKTLGTILIVLLVTAAFGTVIYFIANGIYQSNGDLAGGFPQPGEEFTGNASSGTIVSNGQDAPQLPEGEGGSGNGPRDGSGQHRGGGGGEEELSPGQNWLELLKDVAIIALVTLVLVLIPKVFRRKRAVETISLT